MNYRWISNRETKRWIEGRKSQLGSSFLWLELPLKRKVVVSSCGCRLVSVKSRRLPSSQSRCGPLWLRPLFLPASPSVESNSTVSNLLPSAAATPLRSTLEFTETFGPWMTETEQRDDYSAVITNRVWLLQMMCDSLCLKLAGSRCGRLPQLI